MSPTTLNPFGERKANHHMSTCLLRSKQHGTRSSNINWKHHNLYWRFLLSVEKCFMLLLALSLFVSSKEIRCTWGIARYPPNKLLDEVLTWRWELAAVIMWMTHLDSDGMLLGWRENWYMLFPAPPSPQARYRRRLVRNAWREYRACLCSSPFQVFPVPLPALATI